MAHGKALALIAVCYLLVAPTAVAAQTEGAAEAAEEWLALVDAEDYGASWAEASRSFQSAVTAETWAAQLTAGRAQVGAVEERELAHTQPMTDPPGAPAGEYVQLRYDSAFGGVGRVTEHVVLVRDGERGWRVAGYFIQPAG